MSREPPVTPPPPFFPDAFTHTSTRSSDSRRDVTGDQAYLQGRSGHGYGHGHGHPQATQMVPNSTGYPSEQYYPSQPHATSHRSTLATTPTYSHASLSTHPPAPPPISGSTSYNPSFPQFPMPDVSLRHPSTNRSGPPPPPISHRATTMPMNVHPNASLSLPYDMPPQNTMHSPLQPTHGWSYLDVHDRDDRSSNFSDEDLEQSRGEGTHRSGEGEYMQERSPPNRNSAGRQHDGHARLRPPPPPERLQCTLCGRISTRIDAEYRRWFCTGGHIGQWRRI